MVRNYLQQYIIAFYDIENNFKNAFFQLSIEFEFSRRDAGHAKIRAARYETMESPTNEARYRRREQI